MAKKTKIAPGPVAQVAKLVAKEPTKLVSIIDDWAFLLSDDPTAINTLSPQALLHAVLPDTANKSKIMPEGSSYADVWMLKRGNPLASVDAALALVAQVSPDISVIMQKGLKDSSANLSLKGNFLVPEDVRSETLPGAIIIALLNYLSAKEKK